jgi:hypothetical protein
MVSVGALSLILGSPLVLLPQPINMHTEKDSAVANTIILEVIEKKLLSEKEKSVGYPFG